MNCLNCGNPLTDRQTAFCSKRCQCLSNSRLHPIGGWNKEQVEKTCAFCQQPFTVPRYREQTAKTCSRLCQNRLYAETIRGKARPERWTGGGIQAYRRFKKAACERCGSTKFLLVHHRNDDRRDNRPENWETLCKRCHQLHHHCEKNLPPARNRPVPLE